MKTVLLGGTDTTVVVGDSLLALSPSVELVGVAYLEREFSISYSPEKVESSRHQEVNTWARGYEIPAMPFRGSQDVDRLVDFARRQGADFGLVAGWYYFVPDKVRGCFAKGCAALHASLLPELRGGAPLNWAILSGKSRTGVTLFELVDEVDAGLIYDQEAFDVAEDMYIEDLVDCLHAAIRRLLNRAIPAVATGSAKLRPQEGDSSYGLMRHPSDGRIDWRNPASQIERLVRATSHPYAGAFSVLDGQQVTIWRARAQSTPVIWGQPGQIARIPEYPDSPLVVTGRGNIVIEHAEMGSESAIPLLMRANHRRFD